MDVHINGSFDPLTLVFGADQVRAADANGFSDPFCVIECAGRKEKTKPQGKPRNKLSQNINQVNHRRPISSS